MKNVNLILLFCLFLICTNESYAQPKLPKKIEDRYGLDMIPNEESAIKLAEIVLYGRTTIKSLDKFKPFTINSIAKDKVWEVIVSVIGDPKYSREKIYKIYINKNTGEILTFWDSH